jgi:hypothetical protein
VNDVDHDHDGRVALEALSAAFADPHRLVDELLAAEDPDDARRRVSAAFGLTGDQAQIVLDNRFGLLTRARQAERAESLRVAQTPLGPPLHLTASVDASGRTVTVLADDVELHGRGRTAEKAVEALADQLWDLARRRHCRVVVVVDGPSRLERVVVTPTRSRFYRDDEPAPADEA